MIIWIIIVAYFLLACLVASGFVMHTYDTKSKTDAIGVTLIIAARNEEKHIESCLAGIASQSFPRDRMEIIVVDDCSNDSTAVKVQEFLKISNINYQFISNTTHKGKKESLRQAISQASNELIITRDADTDTASDEWLRSIVDFHSATKKEFIICPIAIKNSGTLLGALQEIETAILSLFTISSAYFKVPFLCSGANLAFTKNIFYKTNAYQSHIHIPSGDDVFFLEAVKKIDRNSIAYFKNKSALVYTYPEKNFIDLLRQKTRWSAKVFKSASFINWLTASIIAITNFSMLFALFYVLFCQQNVFNCLFFVLSKLIIDILLVFLASSFVKVKANLTEVLLIGLLYPLYASVIVGSAFLMKPKWKTN